MTVTLEGKSVVVTGGGSGLGRGYAVHAASLGANVVVGDIDEVAAQSTAGEITAAGGVAQAVRADITVSEEARRLVDGCVAQFGRVDGLVNNAGITRPGRAQEQTVEDMQAMLAVNVLGTVACSIHAVQHMLAQGGGSIVNVASGAQVGMGHMAGYGATKGAVASLTYCWAVDLRGTGVRVNAVSPWASTPMLQVQTEYFRGRGIDRNLGEYPPEANAPMVCYLLSDAASQVNGQVVRFDRGELRLMAHPALLLPAVVRDEWTVDDIATAFREQLDAVLQPLGLSESGGAVRGR